MIGFASEGCPILGYRCSLLSATIGEAGGISRPLPEGRPMDRVKLYEVGGRFDCLDGEDQAAEVVELPSHLRLTARDRLALLEVRQHITAKAAKPGLSSHGQILLKYLASLAQAGAKAPK